MSKQHHIKESWDRLVTMFEERPEKALVTKEAECEIVDGLQAECRADGFSFSVDVARAMGGNGSAPGPGDYGRAALAACISLGCAAAFAQKGLSVDGIKVRVASEMDARSGLGIPGAKPGFHKLGLVVELTSDADTDEVQKVVREVIERSTIAQTMARPIPIESDIVISRPG